MYHRAIKFLLTAPLFVGIASAAGAQDIPPPPQGGEYGGQYSSGPPASGTSVDGVQGSGSAPQNAPPAMTPRMRQDIATGMAYRLPDNFMPRATSALAALRAANLQPPNSTGLDLEQTIAQMQSIPGLVPILRANGFDARSFVLGMTAFGMTLATGEGRAPPPGMPKPNPANIALFQSHPDQVQALVQAMGTPPGQSRNGPAEQGEMPSP